ncbi:MAG: MerR family transcriptional regulator [Deltaproteobacteria bacterium]|nr:MerR family transcriptional regulator [Deltaproteobacteria bacterium]
MATYRKLFKVWEVMKYGGISRQTVHNYTQMRLIKETERTDSGHRLYDEKVFERLEKIKKLQEKGHSLLQIKDILDSNRTLN